MQSNGMEQILLRLKRNLHRKSRPEGGGEVVKISEFEIARLVLAVTAIILSAVTIVLRQRI